MGYEIWLQLWSGTIGALVAAVVGGVAAVVVLQVTIRNQTQQFEKARIRQVEDAATQLEQQIRSQRNERREAREFDEIVETLQLLMTTLREKPKTLDFLPELVRQCDRLTMSSPQEVSDRWRNTADFDEIGISRHPLSESLATVIALRQVSHFAISAMREAARPEDASLILTTLSKAIPTWRQIHLGYASLPADMLRWQFISDKEKVETFARRLTWAGESAARFLITANLLENQFGIQDTLTSRNESPVFNALTRSGFTVHARIINRTGVGFTAPMRVRMEPRFAADLERMRSRLRRQGAPSDVNSL